ncbi:MAG: sigma-70 family RNA polymerase sigma factor [Gemmatales bacterium]|nr:sigma-70 family RNA polymerase sigma factor [Gemmatales bacterium]MDW7993835.1 sigma-70 family RNA polymerase sigma factor [Gemmatales bacterium]
MSEAEQEFIARCLRREPAAWRQFVDRYLPLFFHVVEHAAAQLHVQLTREDLEDLVAEVLAGLVEDDFRVLRQFEGKSKLSTYLTVVARRAAWRSLRNRVHQPISQPLPDGQAVTDLRRDEARERRRPETIEEIHQVLRKLPPRLRLMVRLHYLEGRSYEEISKELNVPINSIGPALTRARRLLQQCLRVTEEEPTPGPPPEEKPSSTDLEGPDSRPDASARTEPPPG